MYKLISIVLLGLGLVYGLGITTATQRPITPTEAQLAHVIRAPAPPSFEPPRGRRARLTAPLRTIQQDVQSTLERAGGIPVVPLFFDGWTALAGTSAIALRYPWVLLAVLAAAGVMRVTQRHAAAMLGSGLLAGSLVLHIAGLAPWTPAPPDYRAPIAEFIAQRDPLMPLVYAVPPTHPVSYYREQTALTQGVTLDLAWRDFTPTEVSERLARMTSAEAVWVIAPAGDARLFDALDPTHRPDIAQQVGDVWFARYVRR